MGGIGKTTLAQLVYNSSEVIKHFHLRAWVSVPEGFDQIGILKEIIESVKGESFPRGEVDLDVLILRFPRTIQGKRFLFVLDDVWEDNYSNWELLKDAFGAGAPGSVILTTTRSAKVALIAGSRYTKRLNLLTESDSWYLLNHFALGNLIDEKNIEIFEQVGRQIAYKCHGLPLALRTVGGILSSKTSVQDWQQVLEEFEQFGQFEGYILPTLMLSYSDLDPLLRQCILYCSIFPHNHSIDVDKLIKLWMAQDYFDETKNDEMETQGRYYFEELLSRSFFQNLRQDGYGNSLCNMHHLLADFIQRLARNECIRENFDQFFVQSHFGFFLQEFRHCSLRISAQTSSSIFFRRKAKLHTLVITNDYSFVDLTTLSNLLRHSNRLRALDLSHCLMRKLPSEIGKLMHLRYLDFSFNHYLKQLPDALSDLSLLQTLNLNGCDSLQKIPNGIGKLIRLRHLEILWTVSLSYLPKGIGSLTSLRTLSRFIGTSDVNSKACNLGDLEKLSNLQGYISIDGLGSVTDVALAEKANLKSKEHVRDLDLWFSGIGFDSDDVAVLQGLQPPANLRRLGLFQYRGISFPDWMATMKQLRHLMLSDCSGCEILPPLGKLPSLETLEVSNMINLKKVGPEFLGIEPDSDDGRELVSTIDSYSSDGSKEVTSAIIAGDGGSHSKETVSDINDSGEKVMSTTVSTSHDGGEEVTSAIRPAGGSNRGKEIISDISDSGEKVMSTAGSTSRDGGKEITSEIRAADGDNRGKEIMSYISDSGDSTTVLSHDAGNVAFLKLKKLSFDNLTIWQEWAEINGREENVTVMPKLSSLSIMKCPRIRAVPAYIRRNETLSCHIEECPLLNLNEENPADN